MVTGRVAVIGGGITGLAAAHRLAAERGIDVVLFERAARLGGLIESPPFAGLDHVDSAADAFLARVPDAIDLATSIGLAPDLVSPEPVGAAVWYDGLHDIPDGLLLGVPGRLAPLATTRLLSWRGKARAAIEPLLPRTSTDADAIGAFVRARFGDEVHERLVDALVGSIYATDTDRFSLAEVPQLAALADRSRSILIGARRMRAAGTGTASARPVFATPRGGTAMLVERLAEVATAAGAQLRVATPVEQLQRDATDGSWLVNDERIDAVLAAVPAGAAADLLDPVAGDAARLLRGATRADVVMVTLHLPAQQWPQRLRGRSGYLVPKPVQQLVTAASFGSQKWAHWRPPGGGEILRVSLGRDGLPVLHLSDEELLAHTLAELTRHLGFEPAPIEHRVTRWPGAFAQYRPHHARWVAAVEEGLPDGFFVGGAAYRGIGIPACVRQGRDLADRVAARVSGFSDRL